MRGRRLRVACAMVAVIVAAVFLLPPRVLVWAPLPLIRYRLLCATHRGIAKAEVLAYLRAHAYRVTEASDEARSAVPGYPVQQPHAGHVAAHVGGYRLVFHSDVIAFYLFDKQDQLTDIVARRYTDAL